MTRITKPAPVPPAWPRPRLEVRDLELVLALASAGTTAGAASALHLTQSAVSRALAQAEDRVGARLFDRTARGVTPTAAGERLLAGAAVVLGQLRALEDQVAAPPTPPARIRLVTECYTAYRWLPSAMATLRPGLEVELALDHTDEPVAGLVAGELDVALLTTGELPPGAEGLDQRPLFTDEVVFVLGAAHPLATRTALTPADLRENPLLTGRTPPAEGRWFVASVFGRAPPALTFLRLPLTEAIMDAARAGLGVAVVSEWVASPYLGPVGGGDLVVKRLASGPLRRPWRIAWRREVTEPVERLVGVLQGSAPHLPER